MKIVISKRSLNYGFPVGSAPVEQANASCKGKMVKCTLAQAVRPIPGVEV